MTQRSQLTKGPFFFVTTGFLLGPDTTKKMGNTERFGVLLLSSSLQQDLLDTGVRRNLWQSLLQPLVQSLSISNNRY